MVAPEAIGSPQSIVDGDLRLPLLTGASSPYQDADAYLSLQNARTEDLHYYSALASDCLEVLDVGCALGRLTLPLLKTGPRVTALDASLPLLVRLQEGLALLSPPEKSRISLVHGDMRSYVSERPFDLVIAANRSLCHLYTTEDMRAFLAATRQHLRAGGKLAFDLPLPRLDAEGYDSLAQVFVRMCPAKDGSSVVLTERWYQPQELFMHLEYAGFSDVNFASDFSGAPLSRETRNVCVVATSPTR